MSKFSTGNSDDTISTFYKRYSYQFEMVDAAATYGNVIHFQAEKLLYGRVDRRYVPIVLDTDSVDVKYFTNSDGGSKTSKVAPAFVVDAFNDLVYQFQKSLLAGKINANDTYLTAPKVYKAYQSPKLLYQDYLTSLTNTIHGVFTTNNVRFKNFDEFIINFMGVIEAISNVSAPYTYTAYVKNKLCPISTTGLAIEIADLDCANDEEKIKQFVNSKNWHFYLNACRSYGFSVDMQYPWRLVADIGSSTMLSYSRLYNYNSTSVLLGLAYKHAHIEYYSGFKRALLSTYNSLKPYSYIEAKHCQSGRTLTKTVRPEEYSEQSLLDTYSEPYFLKLYLQIRLFEMEAKLTDSEAHRLINDTIELYRVSGIDEALMAFERIIGKTYNYSGSLTSQEKGAKLREEERLQEEELRGAVSTYR
tara:strand:- start:334 stop:1584 length:1251 start_codon:yes stop_codon:yes gene_type:complete